MSARRGFIVGVSLLTISSLHCADSARGRFNSGVKKYEAEDYPGAIAEWDKAIALDPDYAEAYNRRGIARRRASRNAQGAIADFTKAIELKPDYPEAYNNRCLAWNQLGDWQAMADDAAKAIELDPSYGKAIVNRGIAYQGMGENDRAMADYTLALSVDPHGLDGLDAYFHRGDLDYRLGRYDDAISDLIACHELAKRIWPDYPHLTDIHRLRGRSHVFKGDWSRADKEYASWDGMKHGMESYDVFFWYIAREKLGVSNLDVLTKYVETVDKEKWPYPVYQMFLGTISFEQCLRLAGSMDPEAANGNRCEAYFYIAEKCLANGDEETAREYFKKCVETRETRFLEYKIAQLEMEGRE